MSEETEGKETEENAPDYQAQLDAANEAMKKMQAENESMKTKMDELLGEKKKATEKQRRAEQEAQEKLKQNGDFEQLFNSAQSENEKLKSVVEELQGNISSTNVNQAATQLATSLAGNSAEILMPHIKSRLTYKDGGVKVLDKQGNLTINTLDDLKNEIKSDQSFAVVLQGNQASGGGANGSGSGGSGASAKQITRNEFEQLDAIAKAKFMKDGGKLTE